MEQTRSEPGDRLDVAILGGGIAGLTVAYRLLQRSPRPRIAIFEASDRLGGKILSEIVETDAGRFVVEGGPDAFLTQKPAGTALVKELGLSDGLLPITSHPTPVSILKRGRPVPMPPGVSLVAPTKIRPFLRSPLLSSSGKARVLADIGLPPRRDESDESIAAFVSRRLGDEAVDWLAEPLMAGIYNAEPERLSLLATFPQLRALERDHGSLIQGLRARAKSAGEAPRPPMFVTLKNGMQELTRELADRVAPVVRLNAMVERLHRTAEGDYLIAITDGATIRARHVVVTLPAIDAARLVEPVSPNTAMELARLRTVGAGSISLAYRDDQITRPLAGYGLVIPRRERRPINAITVASTKFAGRSPAGWSLLRVFFGGARSAETMFHKDDRLLEVVQEQLRDLLGIEAAPTFHRVYRWKTGSPQYDVGHLDRIAAIDAALPKGLTIVGGAYQGVGIPDIVRAATEVAAGLELPSPPAPLPSEGEGRTAPVRQSVSTRQPTSGRTPLPIETIPLLPREGEGARG